MIIGAGQPMVVVTSELVSLLDADQLRAVLAHEAGHKLSEHVLYRTALVILIRLGASARLPLALLPIRAALLEWSRAGELTCDRAAALVTRDPLAVCRTLMTLAGGAQAGTRNQGALLRPGRHHPPDRSGVE